MSETNTSNTEASQLSDDAKNAMSTIADGRKIKPISRLEIESDSVDPKRIKKYQGNLDVSHHGRTEVYTNPKSGAEEFRATDKKIIVNAKTSSPKTAAAEAIKLADSKGWDNIKVRGDESFRREAWMEATSRGIEVKGYSPSEQDKANLDKKINSIEHSGKGKPTPKQMAENKPTIRGDIADVKTINPNAEAERKLKTAYNDGKFDQHPELKNVVALQNSATTFAIATLKTKTNQDQFIDSVVDKGIAAIANGKKLPEKPQEKALQIADDAKAAMHVRAKTETKLENEKEAAIER